MGRGDGLKSQQPPAQGSALGIEGIHVGFRAVSAKAFAPSGRRFLLHLTTQGDALGYLLLPLRGVGSLRAAG